MQRRQPASTNPNPNRNSASARPSANGNPNAKGGRGKPNGDGGRGKPNGNSGSAKTNGNSGRGKPNGNSGSAKTNGNSGNAKPNGNGGSGNAKVDPLFPVALNGSELWAAELAVLTPPEPNPTGVRYPAPDTLPRSFDGTAVWREYLPPLTRLCDCGATWAAAPSYALNVRYRLWTDNQVRNQFDEPLVLAVGKQAACHWGSIIEYTLLRDAMERLTPYEFATSSMYNTPSIGCARPETLIGGWQYLYRFGAFASPCVTNEAFGVCRDAAQVESTCIGIVGPAFSKCVDGSAALTFLAGGFYTLPADEAVLRQEIWKWGPITSALRVYPDFVAWDGAGVYTWDGAGEARGGLGVALMGWGEEGGVPYWLAAAWDRGFVKIRRGTDMAGIESNAVAGFPKMPLAEMHMTVTPMKSEMDTFLANMWPVHSVGFKLSAVENGLERGDDILLGRTDLITEAMVPDYASMVAGLPRTITFRLQGNVWRSLPDAYLVLVWMVLLAVAVAVWVQYG
jgi:hypothetical protein